MDVPEICKIQDMTPKTLCDVTLIYRQGRIEEVDMLDKAIKMEVKPEIIFQAVRNMKKKERESFLEDLLAATSPEYLRTIKEARDDYKNGRVKSHEEVFGR